MNNDEIRVLCTAFRGQLLKATLDVEGAYFNWCQYTLGSTKEYNQWIGRGLCQGLSIFFLHCCKDNIDFFEVMSFETLNLASGSRKKPVHDEIIAAACAGNFGQADHARRDAFVSENYDLFKVGEVHSVLKTTLGLTTRCALFCSKEGYYLLSTGAHAMAIWTTNGTSFMLEPNAGIVQLPSGRLISLFHCYFKSELVKKYYGKGDTPMLSATRFAPMVIC